MVEQKTDEMEERVRENCVRLAEWHAAALSWQVADLDDLREWRETNREFWQNVVTDGVRLKGKPLEALS